MRESMKNKSRDAGECWLWGGAIRGAAYGKVRSETAGGRERATEAY
jgi:hypothetical protein